jgi:hypothetical protein
MRRRMQMKQHRSKQLIYHTALASADAAKEGDFMGIGGVRVNDAEKAALSELASILNVPA